MLGNACHFFNFEIQIKWFKTVALMFIYECDIFKFATAITSKVSM